MSLPHVQPVASSGPTATEPCIIITPEDNVFRFESWEEAKRFYRERARVLDKAICLAHFFLCRNGQWDEVARPSFGN